MSNDSITLDEVREEIQLTIDEIAHRGAQRMLAVAAWLSLVRSA